ncbi:MAG: hypothetical protein WCP89_01225 [archaeon]
MIRDSTPLTLAEVSELVGESDKEEELKKFIKKFTKMKPEDAKKMRKELLDLDLIKLKDDYIVKIVDFMPDDSVDLSKILEGVSLDQEEVTKILNVVKKY